MSYTTIGEEVRALVDNLASRWNGGFAVLDRLMEAGGGEDIGPYGAFHHLSDEGLERLFADNQARKELADAYERLTRYLSAETWFDRASLRDARLGVLSHRPIAYFCAEFALDDWLPMYSGGLGILAGDVLKEASDMGLPLVAIGLFYRHGFFYQQMDSSSYQTEVYPTLDPATLPLEPARGSDGAQIVVPVPMGDRTVYAQVWQLQVGRTTVYLLDTDTPQNERAEDRAITANLYGGNQETRIEQELVLGIGGVRTLRRLGIDPSVCSMNEGHAAFLGVELLAEMLGEVDFDTALKRVRSRIVYTNHTVVAAGNDIFPGDLVQRYLGPYVQERGIGIERLLELASGAGGFSMALLAFQLSGKANAVSQIHGEVIPRQWPGFKVEAVTNGVHIPTWLGPEMRGLLDRYVSDWRGDSPNWEKIRSIPGAELWEAQSRQRQYLTQFVAGRVPNKSLDPSALTLVWARRFAEYKRAGMLASDLGRLGRLMANADRPLQIVISGKAHPRDEGGKRMMQELLQRLDADPAIAPHVVFVPDYRMRVACQLTAGADVWVNTPRKPLEASGTSGMKASDNGSLQLTVQDGWAAEVNWWNVGWGIEGHDDESDAQELYRYLESSIVPAFYDRGESGVPEAWVAMMKNTMIITLSRYSTRRMVLEYLNKLYLPLIEEQGVVSSLSA